MPLSKKAKLEKAARLYENFSGNDATYYDELNEENIDVGLTVGKVEAILYSTIRDGNAENYIHEFKKSARPSLVANYDGQKIGLVGGKYNFTERGIVDY